MKISAFLQSLAAVCIAATASACLRSERHPALQPRERQGFCPGHGSWGRSQDLQHHDHQPAVRRLARPRRSFLHRRTATGMCWWTISSRSASTDMTPADICKYGTTENYGQQNCFNTTYASQASAGQLTGQDPDGLASSGGVPPIDMGHPSDFLRPLVRSTGFTRARDRSSSAAPAQGPAV